jgi:hypothetical protein
MVRCDGCRHYFKIVPQSETTECGGERHTFCCPHCAREYGVAEISYRGVQLRAQLKQLQAEARKLRPNDSPSDGARLLELHGRMERVREALAAEVRP